jgi:hypothetical protein
VPHEQDTTPTAACNCKLLLVCTADRPDCSCGCVHWQHGTCCCRKLLLLLLLLLLLSSDG